MITSRALSEEATNWALLTIHFGARSNMKTVNNLPP